MLVDDVGRLNGVRVVELNVHDDVNPGAVGGADGEVRVHGIGDVFIEEEGGVSIGVHRIKSVAIEGPLPRGAQAAEA